MTIPPKRLNLDRPIATIGGWKRQHGDKDMPSTPYAWTWCERANSRGRTPCCLRPPVGGSAFGATHFRGHFRVHCCYGLAESAYRKVVRPSAQHAVHFDYV